MRRRAVVALFLASQCGAQCFFPSERDTFVSLNYPPSDPTAVHPLNVQQANDFRLYTTVMPLLASGFENPALAGDCMASVLKDRPTVASLYALGMCVGVTPSDPKFACATNEDIYTSCAAHNDPFIGTCTCAPGATTWQCSGPDKLTQGACAGLSPNDLAALHTALADFGQAIAAYDLNQNPLIDGANASITQRGLGDDYWATMTRVLPSAIGLLQCKDASRRDAWCAPTLTMKQPLPALALSGGAANGAFLAGYVYELLLAREAAVTRGGAAAKAAADARFAAITSTSVGSLIAPIVDLDFASATASDDAVGWCESHTNITSYKPVEDCIAGGPRDCDDIPAKGVAARANQRCALRMLRKYLTDTHVQDILCINGGTFSDFLKGPQTSIGAFEPLERDLLKPFFGGFGDVTLANDVVHVVTTADITSGTVLGLDERVCRSTDPAVRSRCLVEGVMASIPNPLFARGAAHAFTGLGEIDSLTRNGHWLDGGLRSGDPALRAAMLTRVTTDQGTRGHVLALTTEHSEGDLASVPKSGMEINLDGLGTMVDQGHRWEAAYATLYQPARATRAANYHALLQNLPPSGIASANPGALFGDVFSVWMPQQMDPPELVSSGYQYDPLWMRGSFLYGQRVANDQMRDSQRNVLDFLGWSALRRAQPTYYDARKALLIARYGAYMGDVAKAKQDKLAAHIEQQKKDIAKMELCAGTEK